MPPGATLAPPSLLVNVTAGAVASGVKSLLVAVVVPLLMLALLVICVVLAATGLMTVTANVREPLVATARRPTVSVHTVPAAAPFAQLQTPVLPAVLKVVLAGTVSLNTTPVMPILPVLA